MSSTRTAGAGPFTLDQEAWGRMEAHLDRALALARRGGGRAVASVTVEIPAGLDLSAVVLAARGAGDHCFAFEQPARDAHAVCTLGAAEVVQGSGPGRAASAAQACRELGMRSFADGTAGEPPATGPIFCGGLPLPRPAAARRSGRASRRPSSYCRRCPWCAGPIRRA